VLRRKVWLEGIFGGGISGSKGIDFGPFRNEIIDIT
jgi:hypothetical protein